MEIKAVAKQKKETKIADNKVWRQSGSIHFYADKAVEIPLLKNHVYTLCASQKGYYLDEYKSEFGLPAKIYGDDTKWAKRVVKTWNSITGNLGVLLNGVKGSGKSVTAKTICNLANLPVILITANFEGASEYLASIKQDFIVFVDEYEKIYGERDTLLSLMDGAFSGSERRFFVLTTNEKRVSQYILDRPSRIRYVKSYDQISASLIEDMVDDLLKNKSFKHDVIKFFQKLQILTIDIIGQVINEVNIHDELPDNFADFFNVTVSASKYNVFFHDSKGDKHLLSSYDDRGDVYTEDDINYEENFYINSRNIGQVMKFNENPSGSRIISVKLRDEHYWKFYKDIFTSDGKNSVKMGSIVNISFEQGEPMLHSSYQGYGAY